MLAIITSFRLLRSRWSCSKPAAKRRVRPYKIPRVRETLYLCSHGLVARFLDCSREDIEEHEKAGRLTPNHFWDEFCVATAFYPEREKRRLAGSPPDYRLEEVLALMPRSQLWGDLRALRASNMHLKAGIVRMGFFLPHLDPTLSRRNKVIRA
jgi:hypothetical protein